ncbi:MAG: hypothetical protein WBH03_13855 [Cyclobacteriaceae bacterium]
MAKATTIEIYNKTGNKDLWLFFDYQESGSQGVTNFSKLTYVQPWAGDNALELEAPYTCSFDYLNSGTFRYIVANETGTEWINNNNPNPTFKPPVGVTLGTADPNWVGGFFELSYLSGKNNQMYLDITNVDQVGLCCELELSDGNKCGYGESANDMIAGLKTACDLAADTSAEVTLTGTGGNTYTKLWGPPVASVSDQYSAAYDDYIEALKHNNTKLSITSDSTIGSTHCGTQLKPFNFTGYFGSPKSMPDGNPIDKDEVVLWFEGADCPSAGKTTHVYFTKDAINGGTIMSGNSNGGMYIYPAFEYADSKDQSTIKKGGWASNVSLNWTATGAQAVQDTTCFQAMISSVARDLITAMNMGYIGVTPPKDDFTYGDKTTYATAANQKKYINRWNESITSHSDSYGMAYSDAAHQKVLFNPVPGSVIKCYVLPQDEASVPEKKPKKGPKK